MKNSHEQDRQISTWGTANNGLPAKKILITKQTNAMIYLLLQVWLTILLARSEDE